MRILTLISNHIPLIAAIEKASASDYGILLHLASKTRTEIDKISMSRFVGIKIEEDKSYTVIVPYPKRLIESVTSDSICEIARDLGWRTERHTVKYEELPSFSELLAVSTAGTLVPIKSIKSITRKSTNDVFAYNGGSDKPSPCCAKLLSILKGIQQGKVRSHNDLDD